MSSIQHSVNETVERFMPGSRLWVRMPDATAQSQICCLQHGETGVKCVKYILYEAALRGPAGGECVFL